MLNTYDYWLWKGWLPKRVERVEDVVAVGDELIVMVTEIDQQGRINLSRKDALAAIEAKRKQQG